MASLQQADSHPDFRNAVYLEDGSFDCEIDHPAYGWIPTTITKNEYLDFFEHVVLTGTISAYEPPSRIDQRAEALARVDQEHARFLRELTGNATVEERDTWKIKEDAARAVVAGTYSLGQLAMLQNEADGRGSTVDYLANSIISKAEAFQSLIGLASKVKARAKGAIDASTSPEVPIEAVAASLDRVFSEIAVEIDGAIDQWKTKKLQPARDFDAFEGKE